MYNDLIKSLFLPSRIYDESNIFGIPDEELFSLEIKSPNKKEKIWSILKNSDASRLYIIIRVICCKYI